MREYIDEQTGIRLTIELESGGEKGTVFVPDSAQDLTYEEMVEAIQRLLQMAKGEKNGGELT